MDMTQSVLDRYSTGASEKQTDLCCPIDYDTALLALLPKEIIEKDYGCGDPTRYVQTDDVVLDLGSGGGKICYMAAQLVGPKGHIIGVDMNDDMLALARQYQAEMAEKLGNDRVRFMKGKIQDLSLDLDTLAAYLQENPISSEQSLAEFEQWRIEQRKYRPFIPDQSVDLVISNCVLNLVSENDRNQMIHEIFRVLKPGGRVAISDIICDQPIPNHLKNDARLWSGCISGAFETTQFLNVFKQAGFHAIRYDKWEDEPWQRIEDIAFRSVTLTAVKALDCAEDEKISVIYRGPFEQVTDDSGIEYRRGENVDIDATTYSALATSAYAEHFVLPTQDASATSGGCCGASTCC